jgi:hypothetical protein
MNLSGDARGYAIARRTLIHAVRALAPLSRDGFILVGAHAVYLRAPELIPVITPFTLDGDLAADPRKIRVARRIPDYLEPAGFVFRDQYGGFYSRADAAPEDRYASKIDILVPEGMNHLWDGANYGTRDALAVHSQPGLELCVVDHSRMRLGPIGADQGRIEAVDVEVASALALLIAKGWKIGERHEQGREMFEEARKDVADVYRLLRAADPEEMKKALIGLPSAELRDVARAGADHVRTLCGRGGDGTALFAETLGAGEEAAIMVASLEVLAEEFGALVEVVLGD